jgi:acyl-CoA synthetase (NDP forming)
VPGCRLDQGELDSLVYMKLFVEPASIAIVGATRQTGPGSFNIVERLLSHKYTGTVYPVNPNTSEILGVPAYPRIGDIPSPPDLAVIPVWERADVPQLVRECVEAGVKAIIVITQGFADGDAEGKALQAEVIRIAREGGVRILGPNSLGVANAFVGLTTSFLPHKMERVPVGVVCQSGIFFLNMRTFTALGKAIDIGNGGDIHFVEALRYYECDPETGVILLHIEGLPQGRRFMEAALRISRQKPIVALKVARHSEAARAVQSHTGSLSGRDEIVRVALRQAGVIEVDDIGQMEDLAKAFLRLPPMRGRRVGIISVSGGAGVMVLDACHDHGLTPAELTSQTHRRLRELSPDWMKSGNPVDMWPMSSYSGLSLSATALAGLKALLEDPGVDGVVLALATPFFQEALKVADALPGLMQTYAKPIAWWTFTGSDEERDMTLEKRGIVIFQSAGRATAALARLAEYEEFRRGHPG